MSNDDEFDLDSFDFPGDEDNDLRDGVGEDEFPSDETNWDDMFPNEDTDVLDEDAEGLTELDELGDEFGFDEEGEEGGGGGPSRTFIMLAGAMIVLFIVALLVVVVLATRKTGPSNAEMTASVVVAINSTRQVEATETAAANEILFAQQTQDAQASPTPTTPPVPTFAVNTDVLSGPDPAVFEMLGVAVAGEEAEIVAVNSAGDWLQVRYAGGEGWVPRSAVNVSGDLAGVPVTDVPTPVVATPTLLPFDMTSTALAQPPTTVPEITEIPATSTPAVNEAEAVAMTATALANMFLATPTSETGNTGGFATAVPGAPTALPETGMLDDVLAGGSQGFGVFLLMAVGLVGVIVVSRRLRATTNK